MQEDSPYSNAIEPVSVTSAKTLEMDDWDCQRSYGANDMDANDSQTWRQVQPAKDDSAIPALIDLT